MTKFDIINHLNTYASATIYLELNYFVDFPTFPTMNNIDKNDFIQGLTSITDSANISIEIDTENNLKITTL